MEVIKNRYMRKIFGMDEIGYSSISFIKDYIGENCDIRGKEKINFQDRVVIQEGCWINISIIRCNNSYYGIFYNENLKKKSLHHNK